MLLKLIINNLKNLKLIINIKCYIQYLKLKNNKLFLVWIINRQC